MNYLNDFEKALKETLKLGLEIPPVPLPFHSKSISEEDIFQIVSICIPILKKAGFLSSSELNGRCAAVHLLVKDILKKCLNIESYITIGSMHYNNHNYCSMSYEGIQKELASPNHDQGISAHVWLTLSDGSVFDWTGLAWLHTNLGEQCAIEECITYVPPNGYKEEWYYKPYLIGEEYLKKVGVV